MCRFVIDTRLLYYTFEHTCIKHVPHMHMMIRLAVQSLDTNSQHRTHHCAVLYVGQDCKSSDSANPYIESNVTGPNRKQPRSSSCVLIQTVYSIYYAYATKDIRYPKCPIIARKQSIIFVSCHELIDHSLALPRPRPHDDDGHAWEHTAQHVRTSLIETCISARTAGVEGRSRQHSKLLASHQA